MTDRWPTRSTIEFNEQSKPRDYFNLLSKHNAIMQRTANENAAGLRRTCKGSDLADQIFYRSYANSDWSLFLGRKVFLDPICCLFLTWIGHDFSAGFRLTAVSSSGRWHYTLDFSYCPLSLVVQVTLANLQKFGFEFRLRSSPSAFSN